MAYEVDDSLYDNIDTDTETWDELPADVQSDLAVWLNRDPDEDDKQRLVRLYVEERFRAWDCPHCHSKGESTRVFRADVHEEERNHFPDSLNQDFSFFGDRDKYTEEYVEAMCDSCRCHG